MNTLRQRVTAREQGRARVVSVTTTVAVASVAAAGAVATALPGAAVFAEHTSPPRRRARAGRRPASR